MKTFLSLTEISGAMRRGEVTPSQLVAGCLERIDRFEDSVKAWVLVDSSGALEAAQRLTQELAAGKCRGPLHGIPLGIKDIVDVAGMPTRAGSALTSASPAQEDATVVDRLRQAGAIILGKTITTEFACFDPSPTRNPWNLTHTPGGSSSGSAAAVSLGMCLGALASQTGGSITRPASYCGVASCKPTFGRVSRAGVVPVGFHLDHVGAIARTAADTATILHTISGDDPRDPAVSPRENFKWPMNANHEPPRLGVIRPFFFTRADEEVARLTQQAIDGLRQGGATVIEISLPDCFDDVHAMHRRIMAAEAADYHFAQFSAPRPGYGPNMAGLLEEGFAVSMSDYQEALRHQKLFQNALARSLVDLDALLTPATPTAAPGLETTGDPRFNSPWSYAGVPTVSIPCALTGEDLPIALQFIGPAWSEARLLSTAIWAEKQLGFHAIPGMLQT